MRGTFVVNAADAMFGVLFRPVFDMIFRTVAHLLLVQSHRSVTVHASNSFAGNIGDIGGSHFNPFP